MAIEILDYDNWDPDEGFEGRIWMPVTAGQYAANEIVEAIDNHIELWEVEEISDIAQTKEEHEQVLAKMRQFRDDITAGPLKVALGFLV